MKSDRDNAPQKHSLCHTRIEGYTKAEHEKRGFLAAWGVVSGVCGYVIAFIHQD
jgi:hypothetical protein